MRVLVDTPIWSLSLRRRRVGAPAERALLAEWRRLVTEGKALLPAPVRYEILSGLAHESAFERVRGFLRPMPEIRFETPDFEEAARCRNRCAAAGLAAAPIDMFLCALSLRHGAPIFTTDREFERYARVIPIRLHEPR
ncbi:MAG TPA: PIN domain-containing protein [Planctomycetota bacterium]|nr:PIN domain-containing protein [Planctomycetota bacterium]